MMTAPCMRYKDQSRNWRASPGVNQGVLIVSRGSVSTIFHGGFSRSLMSLRDPDNKKLPNWFTLSYVGFFLGHQKKSRSRFFFADAGFANSANDVGGGRLPLAISSRMPRTV